VKFNRTHDIYAHVNRKPAPAPAPVEITPEIVTPLPPVASVVEAEVTPTDGEWSE
jgi:hypothetical protein